MDVYWWSLSQTYKDPDISPNWCIIMNILKIKNRPFYRSFLWEHNPIFFVCPILAQSLIFIPIATEWNINVVWMYFFFVCEEEKNLHIVSHPGYSRRRIGWGEDTQKPIFWLCRIQWVCVFPMRKDSGHRLFAKKLLLFSTSTRQHKSENYFA